MSRSYRKHPICKDAAGKFMKRFANKAVRHNLDIPNGKAYKKCFESWNISDWCYLWSKEEAIKDYERAQTKEYSWIRDHFDTLEQYLIYWEKCTKRK